MRNPDTSKLAPLAHCVSPPGLCVALHGLDSTFLSFCAGLSLAQTNDAVPLRHSLLCRFLQGSTLSLGTTEFAANALLNCHPFLCRFLQGTTLSLETIEFAANALLN